MLQRRRRPRDPLLDVAGCGPVLPVGGVAIGADAGPEGLVVAAGAPGPAGARADRQVVVPEREPRRDGADDVPEQDVEAVVPEVEPPRARDEDRREEREHRDHQQVDGRGRRLPPHREHGRVVRRVLARDLGIVRVRQLLLLSLADGAHAVVAVAVAVAQARGEGRRRPFVAGR